LNSNQFDMDAHGGAGCFGDLGASWQHLSPQFILDSETISSKPTSGGQIITMMQAAKPWSRYNSTALISGRRSFTARRRSLCQAKVRPVLVIITNVLVHEAFQMTPVNNDHMVYQIPAATPNPALRHTVGEHRQLHRMATL
jgi:hypothetical protein